MILALIPAIALASAAPWQPNTGQLVLEHAGAPPLGVGADLLPGDQDEFVGEPQWAMKRDQRGWSPARVMPGGKGQLADPRLVVEGLELWVLGGPFSWTQHTYRARWVDGVWRP